MTDKKRTEWLNILFAFLMAFIAWMYVIITVDPVTTKIIKDVPITFENEIYVENQGLAVRSMDVESVNVTIEAKRSVIGNIDKGDVSAVVNLDGAEKGNNGINIKVDVPGNATLVKKSADMAVVNLEERIYKTFSARAEYTDDSDISAEPMIVDMTNKEYVVSGAKHLVNDVAYVSLPVNAAKVKDHASTFSIEPVPVNEEGVAISYLDVDPSETSVTVTAAKTKTVNLKLDIDMPENDEYDIVYTAPTTVMIKGSEENIANITEITTKPISTAGMTESVKIPIEYDFPKGVTVANASMDRTIDFIVTPYTSKEVTIKTSDIKINGLASNRKAKFEADKITLEIIGLKSNLDNINADNLTVTVDGKNLSVGENDVKLNVKSDYSFYKAEPYGQVIVDVTKTK